MTSIWKWESGNLQIKKSLLDGLQITETAKEVISVVGAGGKTTTIRRLTDEMEKRQKNVAVTTTTRMKKEPHFLLGADAERITQRWGQTHQVWFGEQDDNPEKVRGVSEALLDEVRKYGPDLFLIEADGARRLPCKVPESWEPVIYQKSTRVLAVYGLDAVGKSFREACFRPGLAAEILEKKITDPISAVDIARLALESRGGKKNGKTRVCRCDSDSRRKAGRRMKIVIKGAGDLATGIASRLYHAGHQIVMTEIAVPLTVRRSVALSRAVYENEAEVEDLKGVLVKDAAEADRILQRGEIPVLVDPEADIIGSFHPDVVVDAILAKKNLGTRITDAPFVIGVGPGFYAGKDCHCVIETKRGHTLGNVIWEKEAIPNTGVPGNIGGFTTERLIRASADGIMEPVAEIGDTVEKGQLVARTGKQPVYAKMSGIVRGMLQKDVQVTEGLKIGDIDARCEPEHCVTISDKARAVGGGVLEAVSLFGQIYGNYGVALLAAGEAKRFGSDKLSEKFQGIPLYRHALEKLEAFSGLSRVVVTAREALAEEAQRLGIHIVENRQPEQGISHSVSLALQELLSQNPDLEGVLFLVCDQPGIQAATIQKILNEGCLHKNSIVCAGYDGMRGNPVLWGSTYFQELMHLTGDTGGRQLMKQYEEKIRIVECAPEELKDIDRREDMTE